MKPSTSKPVWKLTYTLKNSIYVQDKLTTGASNSLLTHYPPFSSTVYKLLEEGGAIKLYSSSLDEFGMGSLGLFGNKGIVRNPHSPRRVCGGSSSGSAYLISKKLVDFAIGTDTGGSARTPASYNSIYGFKPSYGAVSREGILPLTTLLDTPAVLSNSVDIISRVFSVISAPDLYDMTTWKTKKIEYRKCAIEPYRELQKPLRFALQKGVKVRFLVLKEVMDYPQRSLSQQESQIRKSFLNLVSRLKCTPDCEILTDSIEWPPILLAELVYKIIAYSELVTHYLSLNSILVPWDKEQERRVKLQNREKRGSEYIKRLKVESSYIDKAAEVRARFGDEVKIRHLIGYFFLYRSNYEKIYLQARKIVTLYFEKMSQILSRGGILLAPATNNIAPLIESSSTDYVTDIAQSILLLANFAGTPSISIPWLHFKVRKSLETVYIGLHLTCKSREDRYLLSAVSYLERNKLL
nr:amidase family protein [Candidatus Mycoplasma haematominutum]